MCDPGPNPHNVKVLSLGRVAVNTLGRQHLQIMLKKYKYSYVYTRFVELTLCKICVERISICFSDIGYNDQGLFKLNYHSGTLWALTI